MEKLWKHFSKFCDWVSSSDILFCLGTNITSNDSEAFITAPNEVSSNYEGVDYANAAVCIILVTF